MNKTMLTLAAASMCWWLLAGWLWGESRYRAGYRVAEMQFQAAAQRAAAQMRQQQYQASQTYQAAKAEREAAQQIRKDFIRELAQRPAYQRDCLDADGLRELNAAIGKK